MNITPDWVLISLQLLPFLVTVAALHYILFKPMLAYLKQRQDAIDGNHADAQKLLVEVEKLTREWEERLAAAHKEGASQKAILREQALKTREELIKSTRIEADTQVSSAIEVLEQEKQAAKAELEVIAKERAQEIATRLLKPAEA